MAAPPSKKRRAEFEEIEMDEIGTPDVIQDQPRAKEKSPRPPTPRSSEATPEPVPSQLMHFFCCCRSSRSEEIKCNFKPSPEPEETVTEQPRLPPVDTNSKRTHHINDEVPTLATESSNGVVVSAETIDNNTNTHDSNDPSTLPNTNEQQPSVEATPTMKDIIEAPFKTEEESATVEQVQQEQSLNKDNEEHDIEEPLTESQVPSIELMEQQDHTQYHAQDDREEVEEQIAKTESLLEATPTDNTSPQQPPCNNNDTSTQDDVEKEVVDQQTHPEVTVNVVMSTDVHVPVPNTEDQPNTLQVTKQNSEVTIMSETREIGLIPVPNTQTPTDQDLMETEDTMQQTEDSLTPVLIEDSPGPVPNTENDLVVVPATEDNPVPVPEDSPVHVPEDSPVHVPEDSLVHVPEYSLVPVPEDSLVPVPEDSLVPVPNIGDPAVDSTSTQQVNNSVSIQNKVHVRVSPLPPSVHSITNARYRLGTSPRPDHSNDDTSFMYHDDSPDGFSVYGVFDGHDGDRASLFARDSMRNFFETKFKTLATSGMDVREILDMIFYDTEDAFFNSMRESIEEKKKISQKLQGLKSYEAYMRYPHLVDRLQELDPCISGGTTAVVTVLMGGTIYVANTGDSRAVVVQQLEDEQGTLIGTQLSEDHTTDNERELLRLEEVGLSRDQLKKHGRLGSQENTRCIGDYQIKEGYKEVDTISHATQPPGIATPTIHEHNNTLQGQYLLLMTDGVYKAIESMYTDPTPNEVMEDLMERLSEAVGMGAGPEEGASERMLLKIERDHLKTYQDNAKVDERSPLAVQCRKRDDMTLVIVHL